MKGQSGWLLLRSFILAGCVFSLGQASEIPSPDWIEEPPFIEDALLLEGPKSCQFLRYNDRNPSAPFQFECEDFRQDVTQFNCADPLGTRCMPDTGVDLAII